MNILIIGKNSFIGKHFVNNKNVNYNRISFHELNHINLSKYDSIINCAIHPDFKNSSYDENKDLDLKISRIAEENKIHFVMISSRKVYGYSEILKSYDENCDINPFDFYSENKAKTESVVLSCPNTVVLRGSNLFGFEFGRNSFMGFCMNQLKNEGKIKYSLRESIKRDFIDVETSCDIIEKVCINKLNGIYNLSSNYGLEIGEFSKYLIEGYGLGEFESGHQMAEQFIIKNEKIKKQLNIEIGPFNYRTIISDYGKQLCKI